MKTFAQFPQSVALTRDSRDSRYSRYSRHSLDARESRHPLRMTALLALLAISATVLQTAHAAPGGHGGAGWSMAGPRFVDRMLDSVDATPEQRAQIRQIVATAREAGRAQHAQRKALRDQSAALFTQPDVDARAAETLRQQMLVQHDQASKRKMQTMLDVSRVLSPEQRQKLAERRKQRGEMMERHRGERDALEGAQPR